MEGLKGQRAAGQRWGGREGGRWVRETEKELELEKGLGDSPPRWLW